MSRPKGTAEELAGRRRAAVKLVQSGLSENEVARRLGCSSSSVCRWWQAFCAGGDSGLDPVSVAVPMFRGCKLDAEQRKQLKRCVKQGAAKHGFEDGCWTLPRLAELIRREFGVSYHWGSVSGLMKRMGLSVQVPRRQNRRRSKAKIASFKRRLTRRLAEKKAEIGASG